MMNVLGMLLLLSSAFSANSLECLDENNNPVDWFFAYKLPTIKGSDELLKSGVAYTYVTSEDNSNWHYSKQSINSTTSIIGNTLRSFYENAEDLSYLFYNDQPPNRSSKTSKGHNKGVILANEEGGFWLIHSAPHFPVDYAPEYVYPKNSAVYGQSFLCITLDLENLNKVGLQLQYNQPQIYAENILADIEEEVPELIEAASNITVTKQPFYNIADIISKGGVKFTSFAKTKKYGKELYEELVAPYLQANLLVETWRNGAGSKLDSNCSSQYTVNNIQSVQLSVAKASFNSTTDHSKWAVSSTTDKKAWVCVGDINRVASQQKRGGGTVCFANKQVVKDYQQSVLSVEPCEKSYHSYDTQNISGTQNMSDTEGTSDEEDISDQEDISDEEDISDLHEISNMKDIPYTQNIRETQSLHIAKDVHDAQNILNTQNVNDVHPAAIEV